MGRFSCGASGGAAAASSSREPRTGEVEVSGKMCLLVGKEFPLPMKFLIRGENSMWKMEVFSCLFVGDVFGSVFQVGLGGAFFFEGHWGLLFSFLVGGGGTGFWLAGFGDFLLVPQKPERLGFFQ